MIISYPGLDGIDVEIDVDATVSETHQMASAVSVRPVEDGSNPADHIRPEPRRLSAVGMISNHPVRAPKGITGQAAAVRLNYRERPRRSFAPGVAFSPSGVTVLPPSLRLETSPPATSATVLTFEKFDRVTDVWALFKLIHSQGILVKIFTERETYENMAIESLTSVVDAARGNVLEFNFNALEVRILESSTVESPQARVPAEPRNRPNRGRGRQQPTEETDPVRQESILANLTEFSDQRN